MYFEHICEIRVTFGHRNTLKKHLFQRNSLLMGFFISEENSLAPTWPEWISGFICIVAAEAPAECFMTDK